VTSILLFFVVAIAGDRIRAFPQVFLGRPL
jgi:hypothetical protein